MKQELAAFRCVYLLSECWAIEEGQSIWQMNKREGQIISRSFLSVFLLFKVKEINSQIENAIASTRLDLVIRSSHHPWWKTLDIIPRLEFFPSSTTHLKIKNRATRQSTCLLRATTLPVVFLLANGNQTLSWNVGTA